MSDGVAFVSVQVPFLPRISFQRPQFGRKKGVILESQIYLHIPIAHRTLKWEKKKKVSTA